MILLANTRSLSRNKARSYPCVYGVIMNLGNVENARESCKTQLRLVLTVFSCTLSTFSLALSRHKRTRLVFYFLNNELWQIVDECTV